MLFQCALDNRIPIMHPDWITECYKVWLRGDDVNIEEVSVLPYLVRHGLTEDSS
jgi:hypothetical protein